MDPWSCNDTLDVNDRDIGNRDVFKGFEDNFKPEVSNKLPDSEEYLAKLEEKLNKIRCDPNVLRQLTQKREACMQQLLTASNYESNYEFDLEVSLNEPVADSPILRTLVPQKQALTQGEVLELVKYDQLLNEVPETSENSLNNE